MFFFFNDAPPPEIYPLPLHAALPISDRGPARRRLAEGARRLSRAVAIAQPGAGERAARHRGAERARAGGSGGGLGAAQSGGLIGRGPVRNTATTKNWSPAPS